jgi:hypothetical protein
MTGSHIATITIAEKPLNNNPTIAINRLRDVASPPPFSPSPPMRRQLPHEMKTPLAARAAAINMTGVTGALFP